MNAGTDAQVIPLFPEDKDARKRFLEAVKLPPGEERWNRTQRAFADMVSLSPDHTPGGAA